MGDEKISISEAQAAIDGRRIAEILVEATINFKDAYPPHVLGLGVGPVQSLIGFAILRGYLALPAASSEDVRAGALKEAAEAWEAFKAANTTADHFAAVERLNAALGAKP